MATRERPTYVHNWIRLDEIRQLPTVRRLALALKNPQLINAAFHEAHIRADELRSRLRELELHMHQARQLLAHVVPPSWPPLPAPVRPPTLHQAIEMALDANGNRSMNIATVTTEIALRQLYRRRDGLAASPKDVSSRIRRYRHLFELEGYAVRRRGVPVVEQPTDD